MMIVTKLMVLRINLEQIRGCSYQQRRDQVQVVFFLMSWQAAFNVSHQAMYQLLMFPGRFFYVLEEVTFSPCSSVLLGSSISLFIVLDGQVSSTMCVGNVSKHVAIWKEFWRFP